MYFAYRSQYSVIIKATQILFCIFLLNVLVYELPLKLFHFKLYLFAANCFLAKSYWNLSDNGWFSVPLYFLEIGLIWSLYYFMTVAPEPWIFLLIYNRFADLANLFIIGCSIYCMRVQQREAMHPQTATA
ncbi:MAG: hypothetical protein AAFY83_11335 [Pseudomonadota bacterium]